MVNEGRLDHLSFCTLTFRPEKVRTDTHPHKTLTLSNLVRGLSPPYPEPLGLLPATAIMPINAVANLEFGCKRVSNLLCRFPILST